MNRKYYWPVIGHAKIKDYLKTQIETDNLTHAFAFLGPDALGKKYLATLFAKSLFCESKEKLPCQQCPKCRQADAGVSSDLISIEKDPEAKKISIKQIRDLQQQLSLKSFSTSCKCIVIDNAHLLTEEANNALLKTLEEPHEKTLFILIADHPQNLPGTIISRCQEIYFSPVPLYKIENWLISRGLDKKEAKIISSLSLGKPGIAVELMRNKDEIINAQNLAKLISQAMQISSVNEKFNLMSEYLKKGVEKEKYQQLLDTWEVVLRDYYIIRQSNNITHRNLINSIKKGCRNYNIKELLRKQNIIFNSKKLINLSINPILVMENLLITI